MHRAKGLEFVAVAIVDVNAGVLPPRWLLDRAPDATVRRSIVEADKALLHVSATRAKKRLLVLSTGMRSELLPAPLKAAEWYEQQPSVTMPCHEPECLVRDSG